MKKKRAHIDPFSFRIPMLVDLELVQQDALVDIATRIPHESDEELLKIVISRGIVAILAEDPEEGSAAAENMALALEGRLQELQAVADPGLSARATRPFPKPSVMFKKRKQEAIDGLSQDVGFAIEPTLQDHVERYVGFPISDETRWRLQDVLDTHPGLSEEDALAELLEAGLDRAEKESGATQSTSEKKANGMLRLAEALYARARRRCGT